MHAKVFRVAADKFFGCPVFFTGAWATGGQIISPNVMWIIDAVKYSCNILHTTFRLMAIKRLKSG